MDRFDKILRERNHFPILNKKAYFATASTGMVPDYVYEGINRYEKFRLCEGGDADWDGRDTSRMICDAKVMLSEMMGAEAEDIAFGSNSSQMLNIFTQGIPLERGDNVVLSEDVFIADRFAWQLIEAQKGVELRFAASHGGIVTAEDVADKMDERTRAVCLCLVESSTGFRCDVEAVGRLCRENGAYLAVDGVQGLGVLAVDAGRMGIDFMTGNDYKWMMGFCGTGFASFSQRVRSMLKPSGAGWMSDKDRYDVSKKELQFRNDAGRYELGYPNVSGIYGLSLAAAHYLKLGKDCVEEYVLELVDYLYHRVESTPKLRIKNYFEPKYRSGIVYLAFPADWPVSRESLEYNGIVTAGASLEFDGYGNAEKVLRLSIHYVNNREDIDKLINVIKRG